MNPATFHQMPTSHRLKLRESIEFSSVAHSLKWWEDWPEQGGEEYPREGWSNNLRMLLEASSGSAVPENRNLQKAAAESKANKKGKTAAERETVFTYYSDITCCICIYIER